MISPFITPYAYFNFFANFYDHFIEAKKQREEGKRQLTAKPLKEAAGSMMSASSPRGTVASPRAGGAGDGHKVLEKRIIDECTKNKKLWEDPDFPAAPGSLYRKLAASTYLRAHFHQIFTKKGESSNH